MYGKSVVTRFEHSPLVGIKVYFHEWICGRFTQQPPDGKSSGQAGVLPMATGTSGGAGDTVRRTILLAFDLVA